MHEKVKHLWYRAGFGAAPANKTDSVAKAWRELQPSGNEPLHVLSPAPEENMAGMSAEEKKARAKLSRKDLVELNTAWVSKLPVPQYVLREKMTLFWHDHFACRVRNAYLAQQQNNVLRTHALGKFGDLLGAVSKDAAMLQFLNNQQNKKGKPNENFAREVLELFTLGRGHYTEDDIKNAARAFTGWAFNPQTGAFAYRAKAHDEGMKNFKGHSGNFNGDDILNMVLQDPQTALFITTKIWKYFVSEEVTDDTILKKLAANFAASGLDIALLLRDIYTSDWFYEARFVGNRIKSPVELIAGMLSQSAGEFEYRQSPVFIQRALSQVLFQPPNVGGWPSGKEWIDSSSLTFRMSLPAVMMKNAVTNIEAKDDGDVNNEANEANAKKLTLTVDWPALTQRFTKNSAAETLMDIENHLLAVPATVANRKIVETMAGKAKSDAEFVRNAFIGFMSLPEYQLS